MHKPLIGITAGEIFNREHPWAPVVYGQSHTYVDAIIRAGGIPVILPVTNNLEIIQEICERIDGLLMSGGNDITPSLYDEEPYEVTRDPSPARDTTEKAILDQIMKTDKPILAICRGLQFVNIYQGGTLYQDIKTDLPDALNHELSTEAKDLEHQAHEITIEKDSKLANILGETRLMTNTHHHQAIKDLGRDLRIIARADDNVIEAIEATTDRFLIGIQAHPESLGRALPVWDKLFSAFVDEARSN